MPRWDYKCPQCDWVSEFTFSSAAARDATTVWCAECERVMNRQPTVPAFSVKGYSAANGYSEKKG